MTQDAQDWIVFHRVRFHLPRDGSNAPLPGPAGADAWRFYPASPIGGNGMRTNRSDDWGGFGIYGSRDAAKAVFEDPEAHLPFLSDTAEAYHALISPYAHKGQVKWRGVVTENSAFKTAPSDPGGPLIVFTSAGYENAGKADVPRIVKFIEEVDNVLAYYATLPGNLRQGVYNGPGVDGQDGLTVSIWQSDAAMMQAAYKPGYHRRQMEFHRDIGHFDRSSFTRARILASKGSWGGGDPVHEIG